MSLDNRTSTDRRHRCLGACLVVATGVMLVYSGCSQGGVDEPTATAAPTTTTTESGPSSGPDRAETSGKAGSAATKEQTVPFVADTNPDLSNEREGFPVLVAVRHGEHNGYRRYVFTFDHADPEGHQPWRRRARPAWDVRYVPASQAVMDGSGHPVANAGAKAHLRIQFQADMHYADGRSSLKRSVSDEPPDLVFGGDFENQVTWFYGAEKERPFRVLYVGDGRVAVDVVR